MVYSKGVKEMIKYEKSLNYIKKRKLYNFYIIFLLLNMCGKY